MDLLELSASELSACIAARQVSCQELMQATLDRIDALNPRLNAIVSLRDRGALMEEARQRDTQTAAALDGGMAGTLGWLHGIPQAIKDASPATGIPFSFGSPVLRDFVPTQDAIMVQRMKAAGCIVIGKTNVPEFGLGSHTFNEVHGITRNPWNTARSAGGSSGGAAVALAARMLAVADGSDFMGSLRNPAAWNNVFGLRPSQGRVPLWPAPELWLQQLATEGPMGRTVLDVARLLDVQAGYDARVPLSIDDGARFAAGLEDFEPRGVRVGWLGDLDAYLAMEPGILECCGGALRRLEGLGCAIEPVRPRFDPEQTWQAWVLMRAWLTGARIGVLLTDPRNRDRIKAEALWEHEQSLTVSGAQALRASAQRSTFYQQVCAMLEVNDVLALPAAQVWPFPVEVRWPTSIGGRTMDTYHRWMEATVYATWAGLPCISVPAGFGDSGLPMGLQLIGRPRGDRRLLQLAHAYEQAAQDVLARRPEGWHEEETRSPA